MMKQAEKERKNVWYRYILIGLLVLLGVIIFKYARPYLSGFLGAATLYVLVRGQQKHLTQKLHFKKSLSALLILLEVLFFILIPVTGIAFLVIDTLSGVTINPEEIMAQISAFVESLEERLGFNLFTPENLSIIPRAGSDILQAVGNSVYSFVINAIVIVFVLYYMLYSSDDFETAFREILPFKEENKQILVEETRKIIQANAVGIPLMALIQGFFAYMGYIFFGVENAILYAILTAFSTIIPLLGTTIVWGPIGIALLLNADYMNGIGVLLYGFIIIGGVDNVARFLLQKILADIHPLITVIGVFIGFPLFGFWGVIFGPLLLSLFILFINMYRHEYVPGSKAEPRVTTRIRTPSLKIPGHETVKPKLKRTNVPDAPHGVDVHHTRNAPDVADTPSSNISDDSDVTDVADDSVDPHVPDTLNVRNDSNAPDIPDDPDVADDPNIRNVPDDPRNE